MRCVRVSVIVMSLVHFIRVCSLGLRGPLFAASGSLFITCRLSSVVASCCGVWTRAPAVNRRFQEACAVRVA